MCQHDRPLSNSTKRKENLHLQAITMIDPATGWFEIVQSETKTAEEERKPYVSKQLL
jgi:hypothetical protein